MSCPSLTNVSSDLESPTFTRAMSKSSFSNAFGSIVAQSAHCVTLSRRYLSSSVIKFSFLPQTALHYTTRSSSLIIREVANFGNMLMIMIVTPKYVVFVK